MQAINRIMSIVDILIKDGNNKWFTKSEISNETGLPISTIHRLLAAMEKHNMVFYDENRKLYKLGYTWLEYGLKAYDSMNYISYLRPELESLMKDIEASVYLVKPLGMKSMIIERIDCVNQAIKTHLKLGLTLPIYKSAANISMLAFMSEVEQQKTINNFISDDDNKEYFKELLEKAQKNKYLTLRDLHDQEIVNIAAPIINSSNKVVGAINVRFENNDNVLTDQSDIVDKILSAANNISWKLKYNEDII